MSDEKKPWKAVNVATTLPFNDDLSVDFDGYAEHVNYLFDNGVDGVIPNGSLGEYQTLSEEERKQVVQTAADALPEGKFLIPGVGAYGALESVRYVEHAASVGAHAVMALPPNTYRASDEEILDHFRRLAAVGIPVMAYNNPLDTKVDLRPELLKRLHDENLIVSVKEFTGDVRRGYEVQEVVPGLDVSVGTDDVVLELGIAGAKGWVAGMPNVLPETMMRLFTLSSSEDANDWKTARDIYRDVHPLLRWDGKYTLVQAIKKAQEVFGRKGGVARPPRLPLPAELEKQLIADAEGVLSKGYK